MAERDIAAEVLQGLREVKEYRAGTRTLRTTRVEAKPLPGAHPRIDQEDSPIVGRPRRCPLMRPEQVRHHV